VTFRGREGAQDGARLSHQIAELLSDLPSMVITELVVDGELIADVNFASDRIGRETNATTALHRSQESIFLRYLSSLIPCGHGSFRNSHGPSLFVLN
jgi:hypothetical protein